MQELCMYIVCRSGRNGKKVDIKIISITAIG